EATPDLVTEDNAEFGVDGLKVGDVRIDRLLNGPLQVGEVASVEHVVVAKGTDALVHLVGAHTQVLVLRNDTEVGDLTLKFSDSVLGDCDLATQLGHVANDSSKDRVAGGLAEL